MHVAYDPQRIVELNRRTRHSIDELASIRSRDRAAARAIGVVRATTALLEDVWMPLLHEIESSLALVAGPPEGPTALRAEWTTTQQFLTHTIHRDLTDAELLAELAALDEGVPAPDVRDPADAVAAGETIEEYLRAHVGLARELAVRVRADPAFAAALIAASYDSPVIAMLTGHGHFPASFRADLLAAVLAHPWWAEGWEMDKHVAGANALIRSVVHEPEVCLDVLGRDGVADALAGWYPLDQELVADLVAVGLAAAPARDPELLADGYGALAQFIRVANDPAFDLPGFEPGVAIGLAAAIGTYVPTFAPALANEHVPVVVQSTGVDGWYDMTLSTREELIDLFGAVMRTPDAQAALGALLVVAVRDALGPSPLIDVGSVAELAELIDEAAANEAAETTLASSIRHASVVETGAAIAWGVTFGAVLAGVGTAARMLIAAGISSISSQLASGVEQDAELGPPIRQLTLEAIQLEACRRFLADADLRRRHGAGGAGAVELAEIDTRLAVATELLADGAGGPGERQQAVLNAVRAVRDAGGGRYLASILDGNAVHDLNDAGIRLDG